MELYLTKNFKTRDSKTLKVYLKNGGYEASKKVLKKMKPEEVTEEIKKSGLRGRGGAGFPTGLKWTFMPKGNEKPKYIGCNSDESEPGTFKDRQIIENEPHQLIEGLIIASYAMGIKACYIYIRGEYTIQAEILQKAVDEAYKENYLGKNIFNSDFNCDIYVHRGAGAYICGEETGLMESVEGKKGQPRKKPPFPAGYGFWGNPTTINNVETFCHVPHIINKGADWFKKIGTEKSAGNTIFGISGHVKKPGTYELPMGYNLKDLIFKTAGGIRNDNELKAVIPGGSSTKILPAAMVDVKMDHDSLMQAGTSLGTGAVVVMDNTTCMVRVGIVLSHFYRHESCGQCTNCREGTAWMHQILIAIENGRGKMEDIDLLLDVAGNMEANTICALSDAAAWPVQGLIKHFRSEFEDHIKSGKCTCPESFEI
ncbi:MAG TPA: NADH-quinone oxidoreductase subunit NuoF [Nitrospinota bacterium]|jgi:NADH-quinone oxidoreductase subunit F|nr:NADH-quinone oxidoreductase subunit NuoF [Nitrospinota bacterium]